MRILVADDSTLVRERLVDLLSELEGIELVGQVADEGETLGCVRESRPDVVILDARMTERDGLQVLKEIKASDTGPVIIVLSTFPYPQVQKRCEQLGADFFLDKASEMDRVVELIGAIRGR
jgi:two-component system chemotaxis response regulator CheY